MCNIECALLVPKKKTVGLEDTKFVSDSPGNNESGGHGRVGRTATRTEGLADTKAGDFLSPW